MGLRFTLIGFPINQHTFLTSDIQKVAPHLLLMTLSAVFPDLKNFCPTNVTKVIYFPARN